MPSPKPSIATATHDNRHHIAHLQLVDAADIPRFASLGVTANFQALWAFSRYLDHRASTCPQSGRRASIGCIPSAASCAAGGRIVGGSDWFVSSVNPWLAIETAVRREDPTGEIEGVLNADERVDLATMIAAYTINGAWLVHHERDNGSIEVGKQADIVVVDRNLFEIPPEQIGDTQVLLTIFNGKGDLRECRRSRLARWTLGGGGTVGSRALVTSRCAARCGVRSRA